MLAIGSMIRDSIVPEPFFDLREATVGDKTVLLLEVHAGRRWFVLSPRAPEFYVRRGASTVRARLGEIGAGFGHPPDDAVADLI